MTDVTITEKQLGSLEGKVAIVTGGANGIGKAIVKLLIQHGGLVGIADANIEAGKTLEKEVAKSGGQAIFIQANVTDWDSLQRVFQSVKQKYQKIDLVFANAGVAEKGAVFSDEVRSDGSLAPPDLTSIDVNLKGAIYTSKLALHYMKGKSPPGGGLVFTGSTSSYNERPNLPLYSTAKHGVVGLMRALRHQAPHHNINVGLIAPAGTITSLFNVASADAYRAQGAPINSSDSVALAAVYLASRKDTNGQALTIIGERFTEVEESIARTQPLWYGEYNTDMSRRVAGVRLDKLIK